MADDPLFFFKGRRLGDSILGGERWTIDLARARAEAAGEAERKTLHEGGANASFLVRFKAWWQLGTWSNLETVPEFQHRVRADAIAIIGTIQAKVDLRRRTGPLSRVARQLTDRDVTTTSVTGSGSETVQLSNGLGQVVGSKLLVISADGVTHAVVSATAVPGSKQFTAVFGAAFAAGSIVYLLEWSLPYAWPTQGIAWERDDGSADTVATAEFAFESSDDPVDNLTLRGPTLP